MANTDSYPYPIIAPGPTSRYQWVAAGPNPCPACADLDGSVRTIEDWAFSVQPGFHPNCQCFLECIDQVDAGIAYTNRFSAACLTLLQNALAFAVLPPSPLWHHNSDPHYRAENIDDLVPIQTGATHTPDYITQTGGTPTPDSQT